jgi:DNA-binding winged helix-turn-helix (wHTH) protein
VTKFRTIEVSYRMDSCLLQGPPTTARYVRFGPFQVDQRRQRVVRDGNQLRLQGNPYQVLIVLLQKQGETVTRDELKRALWPTGTHVNFDANLNSTINKLRRALSESTDNVSYIETISRRGYSFAGTVEFSDIPFPVIEPTNSATSETIDPDGEQEARALDVFRLGKSLTVKFVALVLVGMLLGATAATYWISHAASRVRHSALEESRYLSVRGTC